MKKKMLHILFSIAALSMIGCEAENLDITASVEEYYSDGLPQGEIKCWASDWDKVISKSDKWARNIGIAKAIAPIWWSAITLLSRADVRNDIALARAHKLKIDGKNVYGAGNYIQYFADKYDSAIGTIRDALVKAAAAVKPIYSTVALYQQSGIPVVVWTNNDYESYKAKLDNLNEHLKPEFKGIPFNPVGVFVAGTNLNLPDDAGYNEDGKPSKEYYQKAYDYTKKQLNLNDNDVVVFVDDQAENIDGARAFAKEANAPLIAIQFTTPEQFQKDVNFIMGKVERAEPFMEPKELDAYLLNREARVVEQ